MSMFDNYRICGNCGGVIGEAHPYVRKCNCRPQDPFKPYEEYLRKLQEQKPAPAIDYDILAEKVAAKVVALLGKKKRRAKR